jgi:thioesterase domain-containing protein
MSRPSPTATAPGRATHRSAVELKPGETSHQLFMFAGAGCHLREVSPLAVLVAAPWSVIGIEAWHPLEPTGEPPGNIEEMGRVAQQAIRAIQPHGPYCLAGYSMGGMVALEAAAAFLRSGEDVQLLALIDCPIHHAFWSAGQRLRGRLSQMRRVARMPGQLRYAKFRRYVRRLKTRLDGRLRPASLPPKTLLQRCEAAYHAYRPRAYAGRLTLITPDRSKDIGVDFAELWRGYAPSLEVIRVKGGHHQLVRSRRHVEGLARVLNEVLGRDPLDNATPVP